MSLRAGCGRACPAGTACCRDETNHGAFFADADGSVWIGTPVGLTHILKPADLLAPRTMTPQLFPARYGALTVASEALPYESGAPLNIAFGVSGNSAGHPVHFRYRLKPLDRDWVDTSQREVRYAALPWAITVLKSRWWTKTGVRIRASPRSRSPSRRHGG